MTCTIRDPSIFGLDNRSEGLKWPNQDSLDIKHNGIAQVRKTIADILQAQVD